MVVGFQHAHTGLAYLIFVACLVNLALVLSVSKKPASLANVMRWSHQVVLWGGRVNLLIGAVFWYMAKFYERDLISHWWVVASVLLWGGVEVLGKRMVNADLQFVRDGAPPGKKLLIGVSLQLLIVALIFAMMSIKH